MCTVSYLPKGKGRFILTSNRDERIARKTIEPTSYSIGNRTLFFPKDAVAGGTWIAASDHGRVCCLLNGAFEKHERKTIYGKSRGIIALESFEYERITDFFETVELHDVEPFTLIVVEPAARVQLYEFRWDGRKKHLVEKNNSTPHIWSSATLYKKQVRKSREEWFAKWLTQQHVIEREQALAFHSSQPTNNPENDFIMKRGDNIKTVSITQIEYSKKEISMHYYDLLKNQSSSINNVLKQEECLVDLL